LQDKNRITAVIQFHNKTIGFTETGMPQFAFCFSGYEDKSRIVYIYTLTNISTVCPELFLPDHFTILAVFYDENILLPEIFTR